MEKKSPMSRVERLHREKVTRYSIRKYSFGAASVAVAALFMFLGNGAVSANELSKQDTPDVEALAPALDAPSTPAESVPAAQPVVEEPAKPAAPEVTTPALDKKQLENYISEVKSKLSAGTYANKTEESLALLNDELASAESTLASATTQDELNVAYRNLVTTVSSKLKNKPKDSKDAPKVDTTNGQPTVGKKAENTEKKSESNAIENTGSNDPRNEKEISKDNPFRTEATDTEGPVAEIPYSEGRNVYVYGGESEGFDIKIKDNSGVVANATILRGGNQPFTAVSDETDILDVEFGYKANVFSTETPASESNPAVIHYTGLPGGTLNQKQLEDARTTGLNLGWRYVKATDKAGNGLRAIDERDDKPGALYVVVKPQTYKYNIQQPENNANKIAVSDINNLTETDIQKIKDQIKIGYSKTSQDARFESKKGQDLDNQASVVKSIDVNGQTITVTYNDDSTDTASISDVARTDLDPVVEFPFSDAPKREIYVYGAEENSFDIKIKDDADKIKSATLLQWGSNPFQPVAGETDKVNTQYGYTANVISSETTATEAKPAVITYSGTPAPEGSFTQAKLEAATKGENPPGVALGWRYLKVVDSEGKEFVGSGKETANNMSLRVMLKPQTQKYDIQTPAEADKVAVDDASEVTEAEFNKIKEKLKIEYSKNNMDARLADKKGQTVENQEERIASIKKVDNNLVVTYKDGSTDTRPLTDFARTNNAPEVTIPYSVDGKKDVYVYANEDFDIPVKFTDDNGTVASATIKRGGNVEQPAKDAANPNVLDNEYESTVEKISTETTATEANPAVVHIKGNYSKATPGLAANKFPTDENGEFPIVTRYATATDTDGKEIHNVAKGSSYATDPGSFSIVLKSQTKKYDIREVADADKDNVTGGNQVNTPADRVVVENPAALTEDDKNAIKAKIQAVNPGADVVFDEKGNATVTTPAAPGEQPKTATIPASDLVKPKADLADPAKQDAVNKPADKVVVDPALVAADKDLPTEAKDAIKAAVVAVNPDSTVVVDDKGNATVTTPEGKTVVIPKADLVKKEADKETAKAGNNINKPADKVVADKDALTPENIEAIKAKVQAVNPGATVVVDDKGNATVVTPDGQTATIPVTDLVKSPEEAKDSKAGNNVNKPADKVSANKDALTPEDIKAIEAKVKAVNPDAKVFVDDKGNATVSTPDGKTATIPVEDLVKDPAAKDEVNGGNKVNTPATKVVVTDPANIKADEDKIKAEILKVNPGATVAFDTEGNATVTTKDGAVATIPASDLAKDAVKKPADKTLVKKAGKLTQAEKDAIKAAVAKVNPENTTVVVDEKGNATVTTPDGKTEVIPASDLVKTAKEAEGANAGNNINKPADKVSATPADLTGDKKDEVKAKIQKAVESVNPGATVFVDDKGNATVTTPDGKTATIPVEDLVKDPGAKETATAGNKVNTPAERTVVANPAELTDAEKDKITAAIQEVNPEGTKVVFDEAGNATVTVPNQDGTTATATIPVSDLVKSNAKEDLENAAKQDAVKKPIDQTVVADKDALTDEDRKAIKAKVAEVNPGATVVVDDKGNATVTTPDGKTAVIPADDLVKTDDEVLSDAKAGNLINKPADRVFVKDGQITDDVKAKIAAKVQRINPGSTVFVDENGNATVTTPEGKTATIPVKDLTKTDADKAKVNAGNKINSPADRVLVKDRDKLTAEDIQEIEKNILEVNPGATVVFDAKGNATVKNANGDIATIPVEALAKPKADLLKPEKQDLIKKPVDKVLVTDPANVDKDAIKKAVEEVNPGSTVVVDDNGNATITTEDGRSFVIPAKDLVKTAEEAKNAKAGNNINKPADKVVVADPTKPLSQEEKKAIEAKIKEVNPDAKAIFVDDKGNATVTIEDKDGNTETATIPAADLVTSPEEAKQPNAGNKVNTPADKVVVTDPDHLSDQDKAKITEAIKAVNPEAKVAFDDKGNATVTTKDGEVATIPAADLVKTAEEAAKPNAGNNVNTPADKTVVANPNALTPEEKKAIAAKVAEVNPGAEVVVDNKGKATVTKDGKTAVIPASDLTKTADSAKEPKAGNDVVKPADKTVVANPESLTKDEKDAIVAKVKAVNPGAEVVVDDQGNATVTPKDGKPVVIPASDLTKSAADAAKPNAGNDIVKPADKTVVANPESLTKDEKDAIVAKVKAVNPGAEVVVDDQGNATVTTPEGKTAVIPAADLTKSSDAEKAPNAGNDIVKPASKTKVANPDSLTPEEKKAIADKVTAVNLGSTVVVDDQGNATVTLPNGNTAVIPASDLTKSEKDVNDGKAKDNAVTPASKTKVANPNALTEAEKKAIEDKVKAANPGATVVVDEKGNATVVKDGNVSVIPSTDLVKVEDDAKKANGGNDANTPAAKTVVADSTKLTDKEKEAVKKAVEAVNPGSTVVVDDQGNATVTKGDGTVLNIPASDLVIPATKLADEAKTAKVKTPAIRTLVGNKENLTKDEKDAVKKAIEAVNPGATVVVDDQGNATVTMPDGSTATISKEQLVKNAEEAKAKNGGNNLDFDLSKVTVANLANITPEEKAKFQFMVLDLINSKDEFDLDAFLKTTDAQGNTVYTSKDSNVTITIDKDGNMKVTKDGKTDLVVNIDEEGNVTIVTKEGKVLAISRDDAFKQRPYVPSNGGGNNRATNTDAKVDKAKLEGAIHQLDELIIKESAKLDAETAKEANDLLADAKKVFANADATQAEVDAMVKRIEDFMAKVAPSTDPTSPAEDQASQTPAVAPATTQTAANASQTASAQANAPKESKELPNTGTADSTVAMVAAAASALLGLGLAGRRRKEDEEA